MDCDDIAPVNVEIDIRSKMKTGLKTEFANFAEKLLERESTNARNFAQKTAVMRHDEKRRL